jgi:hypothetical protein
MQSDPTTEQNIEILLLCLKIVHDETQKFPNDMRNFPLNEQINRVEVKRSNGKVCLCLFEPENWLTEQQTFQNIDDSVEKDRHRSCEDKPFPKNVQNGVSDNIVMEIVYFEDFRP